MKHLHGHNPVPARQETQAPTVDDSVAAMSTPQAWVVIPVHNRLPLTLECLHSLGGDDAAGSCTIVVVDDGSTDGTSEVLAREFPDVVVLRGDGSLWWTGAMNMGVGWALSRAVDADVVVSLNNDAAAPSGWLEGLLRAHAAAPDALLGSFILSAADRATVVDGGVTVHWPTAKYRSAGRGGRWTSRTADAPDLRPVDLLGGCGTLIPVRIVRRVGPYDQRNFPHYAADYELSRRAAAAGFPLYLDRASMLYLREEESGVHARVGGRGVATLLRSFWSRGSANDLRVRWRFARRACPRRWQSTYIPCDYVRVVGGSLARYWAGRDT
jgi:GT2 family glycosyltransferase